MRVPQLSSIEEQIVFRIAGGETTSTIAGGLRLSLKTIEWHLARARNKLERVATLLDRVEEAALSAPSTQDREHPMNSTPTQIGAPR